MKREEFTREELIVLDTLVNSHAETARKLGHQVDAAIKAQKANDFAAFNAAKAAIAETRSKCGALKLALDTAAEAFLRKKAAESDGRNNAPYGFEFELPPDEVDGRFRDLRPIIPPPRRAGALDSHALHCEPPEPGDGCRGRGFVELKEALKLYFERPEATRLPRRLQSCDPPN